MRLNSLPGLLLALAIGAKCLFSLHAGLSLTPDSIGYQRIADAISEEGLRILAAPVDLRIKPRAELDPAVWHDFAPLLTYRMIGYPLIIAAMKGMLGGQWIVGMLMLQAAGSIVTCLVLYRLSRALGFRSAAAWAIALAYAISPVLDLDNALLTDSLYASLVGCLAMAIAIEVLSGRPATFFKSVGLGALLALAMLLRESTQYLALGLIPLVTLWCARTNATPFRRVSLGLALFAPLVATITAYAYWNYARTGATFVTTAPQVTAVHPIFVAERYRIAHRPSSPPAFDADSPLDAVARQMGCPGGVITRECIAEPAFPGGVYLPRELNLRLSEQFGSDSTTISRMGLGKLVAIWTTRPGLMLAPMPARMRNALTVLRPLDLRFALVPPPGDVKVLRPVNPDSRAEAAPPATDASAGNGIGSLPHILSGVSYVGKVLSALVVSSYLVMSIWLAGRLFLHWLSPRQPRIGLHDLVLVAFASVAWMFLLFHAAIHMESRYMQPVAPLVLISFVLMVGAGWRLRPVGVPQLT